MFWEEFRDTCLGRVPTLQTFFESANTYPIQDFLSTIDGMTTEALFGNKYYIVESMKLIHSFLFAIARQEKASLPEIISKLEASLDKTGFRFDSELSEYQTILENFFKVHPILQEILLQLFLEKISILDTPAPSLVPMRTLEDIGSGGRFQDTDDIFRFYGRSPDRLIIKRNSIFAAALTRYLGPKGKQRLMILEHGDGGALTWIRDPILSTSRGLAFASAPLNIRTYEKILEGSYDKYRHYIDAHENATSSPGSGAYDLSEEEHTIFASLKIKFHIEQALKIAGGNVVKAINKHGVLIYIVGLAAIFRILWISYADVLDPAPDLTPRQLARLGAITEDKVAFYKEFKKTKRIIRKLLINDPIDVTKRVIFVDHASYHVDLDILYPCPGVIFVNSYAKFLEFGPAVMCSPNIEANDKDYYSVYFENLNQIYGHRIAHLMAQLQKKNFDIVPIAGSSLIFEGFDFTRVFMGKFQHLTNQMFESWRVGNAFCFLNGIVIQNSEDPRDLNLLMGSSLPENLESLPRFFYDRFLEQLTRLNLIRNVVPIGALGNKIEYKFQYFPRQELECTSETYMFVKQGGLRCSVNKIPGSQFAPLDLIVRG